MTSSREGDHLRVMFDHCVQLAVLLSPDGVILEANPAALRVVGASRSDVVGRHIQDTPWWRIVDDPERLAAVLREAAAGNPVRYEMAATDPTGRRVAFACSLVPVRAEDGTVSAIVAEARDVTDLQAIRSSLQASEARLQAAVGGTLDAIITIDEDQRIRMFNRGAETIFGYAAAEVLEQPLERLLPEAFRDVHRDHVEAFGASDDAARPMGERGEIAGRRKDGELFPAEASIAKADVDGRRQYTVVLRDITERRELERERERLADVERQARLDAEAATRARDEMLRVVSHDLRNPVTGVLMGAKMLRFQLEPDHPGREVLDGIEIAAERQGRLIRDLSDVANIEAGRLSIERKTVRVSTIVKAAARPFEEIARSRDVELATELSDELPMIAADPDRLVQALSNLLDNALKVTPAGGRVTLYARRDGDRVALFVTDTGPGVPQEERERIFERFWRGSAGKGAHGSGLGLAIARGIVLGHGGEIGVEDAPGGGSTFHVILPATDA